LRRKRVSHGQAPRAIALPRASRRRWRMERGRDR
jgi:hypothetical protein